MKWWAWALIGAAAQLVLTLLVLGMFALGKQADRRMAEAPREAKG